MTTIFAGCMCCECDGYSGSLDYVASGFSTTGCQIIAGGAGSANLLSASFVNASESLGLASPENWGDPVGGIGYSVTGVLAGYCNGTCSGETAFVAYITWKYSASCADSTHLTITLAVILTWNNGSLEPPINPSCLGGETSETDVYTTTINWPAPGGGATSGTFSHTSGPGLFSPGSISISMP
jgi:hypothetical protein